MTRLFGEQPRRPPNHPAQVNGRQHQLQIERAERKCCRGSEEQPGVFPVDSHTQTVSFAGLRAVELLSTGATLSPAAIRHTLALENEHSCC